MKEMYYAQEKVIAYRLIGYMAESAEEAYKMWEDGEDYSFEGGFENDDNFSIVKNFHKDENFIH